MGLVGYLTNVPRRDVVVKAFIEGAGGETRKATAEVSGTPVVMGFLDNTDSIIKRCLSEKRDFYYIDHAYFCRGYDAGNFRAVRSGFHKFFVDDRPNDRAKLLKAKLKKWKTDGAEIIVIPPAPMIEKVLGCKNWLSSTLDILKKNSDRKIVPKRKQDGPLDKYLENAHAVVAYNSVAAVEAICAGIPVFCEPISPSAPVSLTDYSKIETPWYPDREPWVNSLCYGQFHISEMSSGYAWKILNEHN